MATAEKLITENIDLWTGAIKRKSGVGRGKGSSKKIELYGVKKLRELILEMAVRGLLVPQDASDEPASVLLERIAAEKAELVKEGKIKKQKALGEIQDTEKPFDLPLGWEWAYLGDLSSNIHYGYTASAQPENKGVRLVRITDIQNDKVNWETVPGCEISKEKSIDYLLEDDDVLIARTGGTIGKSYLVENIDVQAVFASYLIRVKRISAMYSPYIKTYLGSSVYWRQLYENASGTGQPNVNATALKQLLVPIPMIGEQHRIVAKVDELMALCDQLEQQTEANISTHQTLVETLLQAITRSDSSANSAESIELLFANFDSLFTTEDSIDQLKQTILQLAVMGKLVPQDSSDEPAERLVQRLADDRDLWLTDQMNENAECKTMSRKLKKLKAPKAPFVLPKSWSCIHLIQASRVLVDCHNKTAPYVEAGIPIIRTTNIREREFVFSGMKYVTPETYEYWSRRCPPSSGDIMFTREAPMGEAAIIPENVKWCLGQRTMLIRPMHDYINVKYLLLTLTEPHLLERASEHAIGSTVKHLRVGDVENLNIPIPPLKEQVRIVLRVDELMTLCDQLKAQLNMVQITQLHLADAVTEQAIA